MLQTHPPRYSISKYPVSQIQFCHVCLSALWTFITSLSISLTITYYVIDIVNVYITVLKHQICIDQYRDCAKKKYQQRQPFTMVTLIKSWKNVLGSVGNIASRCFFRSNASLNLTQKTRTEKWETRIINAYCTRGVHSIASLLNHVYMMVVSTCDSNFDARFSLFILDSILVRYHSYCDSKTAPSLAQTTSRMQCGHKCKLWSNII